MIIATWATNYWPITGMISNPKVKVIEHDRDGLSHVWCHGTYFLYPSLNHARQTPSMSINITSPSVLPADRHITIIITCWQTHHHHYYLLTDTSPSVLPADRHITIIITCRQTHHHHYYLPTDTYHITISITCGQTPSTTSTSTTAPSQSRTAVDTSLEKSMWPGESIRFIKYSFSSTI